jgi:flagellar motility protein MotE (MotC chaperone)
VRSIRLLPIVICAALALLLFKGIGLVTNGGYVLTGAAVAQAAGGGGHGGGESEASNDATMALPVEPTLTDTSPTLDDGAPTLPLNGKGAAEGAGHGAEGEEPADEGAHKEEGEHGDTASPAATECPTIGERPSPEAAGGEHPAAGQGDCPVDPGVNAAGDTLPVVTDGAGNVVPMGSDDAGAEQAVLERLGARREALDSREAELDMRLALVEAAEKRIAERTAALEALETRINALVAEKKTVDESQFASIVAMYETMKPKEAALIFDQLEMPILLRVASAMSPRKMAPIMAKMEPEKAKDLTANMAVEQVQAEIEIGPEDLGALPQIVGQ